MSSLAIFALLIAYCVNSNVDRNSIYYLCQMMTKMSSTDDFFFQDFAKQVEENKNDFDDYKIIKAGLEYFLPLADK